MSLSLGIYRLSLKMGKFFNKDSKKKNKKNNKRKKKNRMNNKSKVVT